MEPLKWSHDLDTGIPVIDEQHKRIVEYINELQLAQETLDKKKVASVIDELVDYTVSHFAFEESLMEQANYPFLSPHQKIHGLFVKKVTKFVDRFEAGENVTDEMLVMLKRWLINHIKNEDGDYCEIVLIHLAELKGKGGGLGGLLKRFFR